MELKSKIWMTGNLEWFAYINDDDMYLGKREVPVPLDAKLTLSGLALAMSISSFTDFAWNWGLVTSTSGLDAAMVTKVKSRSESYGSLWIAELLSRTEDELRPMREMARSRAQQFSREAFGEALASTFDW